MVVGATVVYFEIHVLNGTSYLNLNTLRGRLQWWGLRLKVSIETTKWLVYAVVREKYGMILSSYKSQTRHDLWPLRVFRCMLIKIDNRKGTLT